MDEPEGEKLHASLISAEVEWKLWNRWDCPVN